MNSTLKDKRVCPKCNEPISTLKKPVSGEIVLIHARMSFCDGLDVGMLEG